MQYQRHKWHLKPHNYNLETGNKQRKKQIGKTMASKYIDHISHECDVNHDAVSTFLLPQHKLLQHFKEQ